MADAQNSRHEVSYVTEVTPGTTPGTPSMKRFRNTGSGLNLSKNTAVSAEIRADRQISSMRHLQRSGGGPLNFELSHASFDDWLESALFGAWATDVLKAGVTPKYFSVERRFTDIAQYLVYTGCQVDTLNLSIPTEGMVTGSMDIVSRNMTASGTSLGSPTDVATTEPFSSDGGVITEGGGVIGIVTALELSLANGVAPNFAVGSNFARSNSWGRSNLTGTLTAYFENLALLNKFLNETESSLVVDLTDPDGNTLQISIPRLKYTGGEIPVDSFEGSTTISLPFQGLLDTATGTNLVITRS